jgi:hypothetical protein
MAAMVAHIDVKNKRIYFFNTRLEMLIFFNGGDIKDWDVYDCSEIYVGESHESIKNLLGM